MIKAVNNNKVKNDLVFGKLYVDMNNLVISPKETMFLKIGNNIIKNKYMTGAERLNFSLCGNHKVDDLHYKMIYNKDIPYIHFDGHEDISLYLDYYTTINKKTICYSQSIMINDIGNEVIELSYDEINDLFNPMNYEGMYILNLSGDIVSAYNKKDGVLLSNELISSDKKDTKSLVYGTDEKIYDGFNNIVIIVSNNKYDINLFKIECVGIDKYKLFLSNLDMSNVNRNYILEQQKPNNYNSLVIEKDNNKVYKKAI